MFAAVSTKHSYRKDAESNCKLAAPHITIGAIQSHHAKKSSLPTEKGKPPSLDKENEHEQEGEQMERLRHVLEVYKNRPKHAFSVYESRHTPQIGTATHRVVTRHIG